jgi:hypothetical protein
MIAIGVREAGVTEIKKGLSASDRVLTSSVPKELTKGLSG